MIRTTLFTGMTALCLAFTPTAKAQSSASSTGNPTDSQANTKATDASTAQQNSATTGTAMTPGADKTNSKDTNTALDKNPSTNSTDSADKSATKNPAGTTDADATTHHHMGAYSDKSFMMKASQGGMTEVELGKSAQDKGSSADVKEFGSHMVMDHSKANDQLMALAQQKGVTLSDKLDAHHQAMVDKMNKLSGAAFDKAYVTGMVNDHKKTVADFETASMSATDPDVKAFATNTLPTLKMHLTDIEAIQAKMK